MAEDIESQNGNLVDQLTLLNENLKEDLDKKRKAKRDRSGLTSALNKLTPAVTSLGAATFNFIKDVGNGMTTFAAHGRANAAYLEKIGEGIANSGLNVAQHYQAAGAAFEAGIRRNELPTIKFFKDAKLLGKNIGNLGKSMVNMTDLFGQSAEDSLVFHKELANAASVYKLSTDILVTAILGLKDSMINASLLYGPEVQQSITDATTELAGLYGQGSLPVITEFFSKTIGDPKGWERMMKMGLEPTGMTKSELVDFFKAFKAQQDVTTRPAHEFLSATLELQGITPIMAMVKNLVAQVIAPGTTFDESVKVAEKTPGAIMNRMLNELFEELVPHVVKLLEALDAVLPTVIAAFENLFTAVGPILIDAFDFLLEVVDKVANGIKNWDEDSVWGNIKTVGMGAGLLFLVNSTFRGAVLGAITHLGTFVAWLTGASAVAPVAAAGAGASAGWTFAGITAALTTWWAKTGIGLTLARVALGVSIAAQDAYLATLIAAESAAAAGVIAPALILTLPLLGAGFIAYTDHQNKEFKDNYLKNKEIMENSIHASQKFLTRDDLSEEQTQRITEELAEVVILLKEANDHHAFLSKRGKDMEGYLNGPHINLGTDDAQFIHSGYKY
tara:strand:+ start:365 stop:2212 length:1848 start_codon:yes stop_codon:yes gene_type:complete